MKPFAFPNRERASVVLYRVCPRRICENGSVFETVNGVKKPPPYVCSVCKGRGVVRATPTEIRAALDGPVSGSEDEQ